MTASDPTATMAAAASAPSAAPLPAPPDLAYALIHRSMRRDAPLLHRAIVATAAGDGRRAAALVAWYRRFENALHQHHEAEDDIAWPLLRSIAPEAGTELDALQQEHVVLSERLDAVRQSLDSLAGVGSDPAWQAAHGDALGTASALMQTLTAHLDREEATVFPLLARLSDEQLRELGEHVRKHEGLRGLAFAVPFVVSSATPDEFQALQAEAPAVLLLLNRLFWQRRYDRLAAVLEEV